jgi:hypothetical protein
MRLEQAFGLAGADLTFPATGIHRCVFIHRLSTGTSQHVHAFEHHQARARISGGGDQVLDVFGNYISSDLCGIGRIHAMVECGRSTCGVNAEAPVGRIAAH